MSSLVVVVVADVAEGVVVVVVVYAFGMDDRLVVLKVER